VRSYLGKKKITKKRAGGVAEGANPSTRRKEKLKIRAVKNEMGTLNIQGINETESWFFEKRNKINLPLAK
jgi:hypothetical protein